MTLEERKAAVPIWKRATLTLEETAAYTGIGINKLREMSESPDCDYVLWLGNKRLFKRRKLDAYLDDAYSI